MGAVLLALVVLVVGVGWAYAGWKDDIKEAEAGVDAGGSSGEISSSDDETPVMLVIGDTFNSSSTPSWADRLAQANGWIDYVVDVPPYLTVGGGHPLATDVRKAAAAYDPDLVLIAGGRTDVASPPGDVAKAASEALDEAVSGFPDADVVMLSPFSSGTPDEAVADLRDALSEVAEAAGVPFVDVTSMLPENLVSGNNVYPTPAGSQKLAQDIGADLTGLGVLSRVTQ